MTNLEQELHQAAVLTFEQLSFLLHMPEVEREGVAGQESVVAQVEFYGPFAGRVEVAAPVSLTGVLAANMLGEDEGITEAQRLDALMEVANVLCGNLLPRIGGGEAVFRMRAPQIRQDEPGSGDGGACAGEVEVGLDEGRAQVRLYLEPKAAEALCPAGARP